MKTKGFEILSSRQVGQRIRSGRLPARANGHWRCVNHPRRQRGVTHMLQWPKGARVCREECGPSQIVFPRLKIVVDLAR